MEKKVFIYFPNKSCRCKFELNEIFGNPREWEIYEALDDLLKAHPNANKNDMHIRGEVYSEVKFVSHEVEHIVEKSDFSESIKSPKDALQLIIDIGFDYDGFNDVDNLKGVIDDLVECAREGKRKS